MNPSPENPPKNFSAETTDSEGGLGLSKRLRNLPDGSLTREEVNAMLDVIEAWDTEGSPYDMCGHEECPSGSWECYACGAHVVLEREDGDALWYTREPAPETGHNDNCPWIKTRDWEAGR